MARPSTAAAPDASKLVTQAHTRFADDNNGEVSTVYPVLAKADPELFGLALVDVLGRVHEAGAAHHEFVLMSTAKPFTFAAVADELGVEKARELIGINATGQAFNSTESVEREKAGRTNPMVNAGAILTCSLIPGARLEQRWDFLVERLSAFAGRPLAVDDNTYDSAMRTNHRNRALMSLLVDVGALTTDPGDALDLYTRQSCLTVEAVDLATMGATLANGGVNPVTGDAVTSEQVARSAMVAMTAAGMYELSGDWLWDVGLPGKSGISGAMVTVSPGKGALASYSPRLDAAGNSVRGKKAAEFLATALDLDVLAAHPLVGAPSTDPVDLT
jgi:glutaminase